MPLLLQDDFFGLIGVLVVCALVVWLVWLVLEVVLGVPSFLAVVLAFGATGGSLEALSRRMAGSEPALRAVRDRPA